MKDYDGTGSEQKSEDQELKSEGVIAGTNLKAQIEEFKQ